MSLAPGTRIGPYEITGAIGAGGMGEVFRARDTKLNRDVAIKVLPAAFADDPERLARFTREAQTLASLNHPNIATIHGIEEVPATGGSGSASRALVMELVEGEDLSVQMARGPIPIAEALPIARQIAEALEAAHEQGIVHRDLKPANIKVRGDGTVKVLDFGLAKAMDPAGASSSNPNVSHSPTLTHQGTQAGMIIGTAAYMSPEQAKGKPVDKRADIWAFGVVLYEMLTGTRLFKGEDVSDTLAAVLRQDVDLRDLPSGTPPRLARLIGRCLDRDLRTRLRDIGEARVKIGRIEAGTADPTSFSASAPTSTRVWRAWLPWAFGAAGMLAVWLGVRPAPTPTPSRTQTTIDLPEGLRIQSRDRAIALSPDGESLALVLRDGRNANRLYLRALNKLEVRLLPGTEDATYPFWSPDGRSLGFFDSNELKRFDLPDGPVRSICKALRGRGASWGEDGVAYFGAAADESQEATSLFRVSMAGPSTPERMGPPSAEDDYWRLPTVLPGRAGILFNINRRGPSPTSGVHWLGAGPSASRVLEVNSEVQYAPPGLLTFVRDGIVMVQPFDLKKRQVSDVARVAAEGVVVDPLRVSGQVSFPSASSDRFVFLRAVPTPESQLTWFDLDGRDLGTVGDPARFVDDVIISPDGKRALATTMDRPGSRQLWLMDLDSGLRSPLTEPGSTGGPATWSPDGRFVAYGGARTNQILVRRVDAPSSAALVIEGNSSESWGPSGWSADGADILLTITRGVRGPDIALVARDGKSAPRFLTESRASERWPRFSPDGRWLAYISDPSGEPQVYVTPYPGPGPIWPVTSTGAAAFAWAANDALVYGGPDREPHRVSFRVGANGVEITQRLRIFGGHAVAHRVAAYSRISNRALVAVPTPGQETKSKLILVTNWQSELKN